MALTINAADLVSGESDAKPILLNKIENRSEKIVAVVGLTREDGAITISEEKTIKIWLKRDNGQFWPSVCHTLTSVPVCLDFNQETSRLFVGLESGVIVEFELSDDFNKLTHTRDNYAHSAGGVSCVLFSLSCEWLLSCGKGDKMFAWHCSETGRRIGSHHCDTSGTCVQFDSAAKYAFVGDVSGAISVLRLQENTCSLVNKLTAHAASVRTLEWDAERQWLFSGGADQAVIVWDIGGKRGTAYELHGHRPGGKIVSVRYSPTKRLLISASDDGQLTFWDLSAQRRETPAWKECNLCELCDAPFFWNISVMWGRRTVGLRQHHCRMCGKAVCDKCSPFRSVIPPMGFEYPVRVCTTCWREHLDGKQLKPLAMIFHTKQTLSALSLVQTQARLLTVGAVDRAIKVWDIARIVR